MKKLSIALAIAAVTAGSAHAAIIVYSNETFEAGTVNYSINGINNGTTSDSWLPITTTALAFGGTGYTPGSSSRVGIVANGDPTDITVGGVEPSGKHAVIAGTTNRSLTSNYTMNLATDNVGTLNISFSYMFYSLMDKPGQGSAIVQYSPNGTFVDNVDPLLDDYFVLASFGFGQVGSAVVTPDYLTAAEETWYTLSMSFTEAGAGITFTDDAAIRINRVPLLGIVSPDTNLNYTTFLDDIVVSGTQIPEPSSVALFGLAGLGLLLRRRK